MNNQKNYLVTGAAGFIGSHVVDELLKRDDINKIYVIDKLGMGSDMDNIADDKRVKFIFEDIKVVINPSTLDPISICTCS